MEMHGIEEYLCHDQNRSLVCGRGCAKKYVKGRAVDCIPFPEQAMQLALKTFVTFLERCSVKRSVLHQVSELLTCGTDQKWSFFRSEREQGSIIEV